MATTPPKPPKKCGGLGAIVMVVVAVVVTAGAAALAIGGVAGTSSVFAAGGAALVGGTAGGVSIGFGTALGASIIGGAVGSAISQGIGMAMGVVDKFSWRQVAAGGIGAGLTAGLGHFGQFAQITEGMKWSQAASAYARNAAMSYSVNQLSGRVAGLDTSFSWRSVASTVVGATVGNAAGRGLGLDGGNLWSGVARSVVTGSSQSYFNQQWARGGKLDFVQLAMDSFGNALGNNIVDRMTSAATAVPVTLAKNGQRAMDMDGVNFLDAGVDTSMPDMRWMDDLNTSIATGSNLAVNTNISAVVSDSYEQPLVYAVPDDQMFKPIVSTSLPVEQNSVSGVTFNHEVMVENDTALLNGKIQKFFRDSQHYGLATIFNKDYVGNTIGLVGAITGKFTSNFEFDRFNQYWKGDGSPYVLTGKEFKELSVAHRFDDSKYAVKFNDGSQGYAIPISTYAYFNDNSALVKKYDYAIGGATIFTDVKGNPVGFYDYYNFNKASRDRLSEISTRATEVAGRLYGANAYDIVYGKYIRIK